MTNTMDTMTPHPDDMARMPNRTHHPSASERPLECPNYGNKSPGIVGG